MKKLTILFFLAGIFSFSAFGQQWIYFSDSGETIPHLNLLNSDAQSVTFTVSIPGIYTLDTVVQGTAFTRLILPGSGAINPAGHPELPVLKYLDVFS